MAVNKTPGQSASGFRLYIDNKKRNEYSPKFEEIIVGAVLDHGGIEYTIKKILDDMKVSLEGMNGMALRTTIVDISKICQTNSEYEIHRDEDV